MLRRATLVVGLLIAAGWARPAAAEIYELRVYHAAPGKIDALNARFRDHTLRIFAKHDMKVVGFWMPLEDTAEHKKLYYILSFADVEARRKAWTAFIQDPEWKQVAAESEKDGKLLEKIDSTLMAATDYSPPLK